MTERLVINGSVSLATTDLGGEGPPIIVMHGLGGTRRAMAKVAAGLTPTWRVVSMDMRSHGKSSGALWSWDAAVSDVEAVAASYGLTNPVVAGHSLGGMVALKYGMAHPDSPGVVNIDGWGVGTPSYYVDQDPEVVASWIDKAARGQSGAMAKVVGRLTRQGRDGTMGRVMELLHGTDIVGWHAAVECPSLAFNAVAPMTGILARINGKQACGFLDSYRRGLQRGLAELAASNLLVTVCEVDATHSLIGTHPEAVIAGIDGFRNAFAV